MLEAQPQITTTEKIKIFWDSGWQKVKTAVSLGNHGVTTYSPDTPYFSVNKDINFYQQLKNTPGLSPTEVERIAEDRLRRGFLNECWEASRVPEPNYVYYFAKEVEGETRWVHESDLHSNLDMTHALTDKIRDGNEAAGIRSWRNSWSEHRKKLLLASDQEQTGLMQTTFGLLSPKKAEYEVDNPYTMSQFNAASFLTPDLVLVKQWAQDLEVSQAAAWANKGIDADYLDPDSHVYQMITKIGTKEGLIDDNLMIDKASEIRGREVKLTTDAQKKWDDAQKTALINARVYLNALRNGVEGETLNNLHTRLLLQVLEPFMETAAVRQTRDGLVIDINCGPISLVNGSAKKEGVGGWCSKCQAERYCTAFCFVCGGSLRPSGQKKVVKF